MQYPPLLEIYLKDVLTHMQNEINTNILLVVFLISKKWDQFKGHQLETG